MNVVTHEQTERPSDCPNPEPCDGGATKPRRRRTKKKPPVDVAGPLINVTGILKTLGASSVDEGLAIMERREKEARAKRIAHRKAEELRDEAVALRDYHQLVNETEGSPIESFSVGAVVAVAFGSGDLIRGLIEEIVIRTRTVEAVTTSKMDVDDRLEAIEAEMVMLQNRARAALELLRRCGLRELTAEHRAALETESTELDHAAEE